MMCYFSVPFIFLSSIYFFYIACCEVFY